MSLWAPRQGNARFARFVFEAFVAQLVDLLKLERRTRLKCDCSSVKLVALGPKCWRKLQKSLANLKKRSRSLLQLSITTLFLLLDFKAGRFDTDQSLDVAAKVSGWFRVRIG